MAEETVTGHVGALHVRRWEHPDPARVVVLVHGYGEHVGRYEGVASVLGERGAEVWGLDHGGHGRSGGERALVASLDGLAADVHTVVQRAREARPELPVAMVGHSMGGLIATRYGELHPGELDGLVLSAPVIGTSPIAQLLALDAIPDDPIDPRVLSRDEAVQRDYAEDPLVWHGPFKRLTLAALALGMLDVALDADRLTGPVLWQHGEGDELVRLEDTARGIALLRSADVEERHYPGARHEIFFETNREEVLADTADFLDRVTGA
ncbi:MAG TPA: lysophospholipase [Solirubrobacteraceae bacterium]|nr:lysophospholipase [Solirubrobacteraceae bacterium]